MLTVEELRKLRKKAGLSQIALATASGIPEGIIQRFEAGTRAFIDDYEEVIRATCGQRPSVKKEEKVLHEFQRTQAALASDRARRGWEKRKQNKEKPPSPPPAPTAAHRAPNDPIEAVESYVLEHLTVAQVVTLTQRLQKFSTRGQQNVNLAPPRAPLLPARPMPPNVSVAPRRIPQRVAS